MVKFVLASASSARKKLLQNVGIEPIICKSDFDESQIQKSNPVDLVQTLALCKANTVSPQFKEAIILGCDSILSVNGEIHGKPDSENQAIARWQKMRGRRGTIYTGHALIDQNQHQQQLRCGITEVYFADIDDRTLSAYIRTGEPLNCAGAFALEGKGGLFIEKIEGCHSNVIGLSLPILRQMLQQLGYQVTDFWP
jgi:septum formation protein